MLNKVFFLHFALFLLVAAQNQDDIHGKIEKLRETPFGQTIVETMAIQLSGPEPLQNLINMLQDLNKKLEGEQERDDRLHERFQAQCEGDLGSLEEIINESTSTSKLLKSQLDQLSPDKQAKEQDLVRKKNEFQELKNELQYQQEKREEEKSRYEKTLDNLEQALYAINETKKMFNDFLNVLIKNKQRFASGFVEKEKFLSEDQVLNLQEISQQINKIKHNVKSEGFNFLLHGIAHITNLLQKDPAEEQESMSMKVLEIMAQVENWIQKQRIYEDISEQQRSDAFQQLQLMLEDHIIFSQQTITTLEGQIESLFSQISSASNEKAEVDLKINVKQTQMDDREADCRNEELDYNKETAKRDKERADLEIALDLVINNIGQLKKEVIQK